MPKNIVNLDNKSQITLLTTVWDIQETIDIVMENKVPQELFEKLKELETTIRYAGIITKFKTIDDDDV